MAEFLNRFLNFIGLSEFDDDEERPEDMDDESPDDYRYSREEAATAEEDEDTEDERDSRILSKNRKARVVNIHTSSYAKVFNYDIRSSDEVENIIDCLKNRKSMVVNLQSLESDVAQRVLIFISGAVYALDGNIQKVTKRVFLITPSNVEIIGNIPEEFKGKSFFALINKKEDIDQ